LCGRSGISEFEMRAQKSQKIFFFSLPISRGVSERFLLQHLSPPVSGAKHLWYKWNGAAFSPQTFFYFRQVR
jgi:hypothetical protein